MPIHNVHKPIGWSSLDVINKFREHYPEFHDAPITYTGRLDPMAKGVMVLLSNEERHMKSQFQKLDKTYKATFLLGVTSDTYDCLGMIEKGTVAPTVNVKQIETFLKGVHELPFPPYSSYRINGKPLHYWAQTDKLDEIEIPIKRMEVLNVQKTKIYIKDIQEVRTEIIDRIQIVRGEFRQDETIDLWEQFQPEQNPLQLIDCTLTVTSGTYIRALAHDMGKSLGCGAVLHSLNRISVNDYTTADSIHLQTSSF